jgi:phosphatidylinositol alpha-1,6-mannosyltransferase
MSIDNRNMADALLVSPSFLPGRGGIESHLAQVCLALAPRVAVLAPSHRDGQPIPSDLPYPSIPYEGRMGFPGKDVLDAIADACGAQRIRKVLLGTPWPLLLLGPKLKQRGISYAVMVHGAELIAPGALPVTRSRIAAALAEADLILPVSHHTAGKLRALLDKQGLAAPPIVPLRPRVSLDRFDPGVSTRALRRRLKLHEGTPMVLALGRLVPRKGTDRLITAMRGVRSKFPSATLVIAGTGPQEQRLRRMTAGEAGVIFAGAVTDADAPALYAAADVFALPVADRWFGLEIEGLGVVLLEAGAAATPSVAGRSGGTPEVVVDGETGFLIDGKNVYELEQRIVWLLENPIDANRMGVWAHTHVEREFSGPALPEELLQWLDGS